jgi:translocation and assembly module TamA
MPSDIMPYWRRIASIPWVQFSRMRLALPRFLLVLLAAACFAAGARAADPQPYKVELVSTGNGAMDSTLHGTSDLVSLRTSAPVSPYGLIARARSDIDRLKTVLESFGYYQSSVSVQIDGAALNTPGLADQLMALPKKQDAKIQVKFNLGTLYHLRHITIDGDLPASAQNALPLKSGDPAVAATVLAAGAKLLSVLGEQGYAFAKVDAPVAYEDKEDPVLDVTFHVDTGAKMRIGEISFRGLKRVNEKLVRHRLLIHTGDQYNSRAVERARADLVTLGVFAAVSVEVGSKADDTDGVPITFRMRERLRHSINVTAAYSTDLGGSGGVTWSDRNVFGNAEQLTVTTALLNAGGSSTNGLGYDANVKYSLPDFGHRDQSLQFSLGAIKQYLDAYDQTATTAGVVLTRKLTKQWTVSAGVSTVNEKIIQVVGVCGPPPFAECAVPNADTTVPLPKDATYYYTLIQLPLAITFDSTDLASPLDDPTHGMRDSLSITPTHSLGSSSASFLIDQIKLATYVDLEHFLPTSPGRSVLAGRVLVGLAQGAGECSPPPGECSLPPDQRFYGGGSASIRGYAYQAVGPNFPNTDYPVGGTALVAGGLEFRQRFGQSFGAAFFVDAGQVGARLKVTPGDVFVGVGGGVRYYTAIGPIRLDLAVPTKHTEIQNQSFQVYIGLGQAF